MINERHYGKEIILDLNECDVTKFNKYHLDMYFKELCKLIKMERHGEPIWWEDWETCEEHIRGITGLQFISTSDIRIHTLDMLKVIYLNIFSCKDFDPDIAIEFTRKFFKGKIKNCQVIWRG